MELQCERRDGGLVVAPNGPVDHESAGDFQSALIPLVKEAVDEGAVLVIDFQGVDYMSSVGLRVLVRAGNEARGASVKIVIANLNETMQEIFRISRFDKLFPICDSVDAALAG